MGDHNGRPGQHLGQRLGVDGEGVDQGDGHGAVGAGLPRHLHQGETGPVGALPVELGVQGVAGRRAQLLDQSGQVLGRGYKPGAVVTGLPAGPRPSAPLDRGRHLGALGL